MCGIVGYTGRRQAYPILIKGLHRLEYRGYDSAGVALMDDNGGLNVYKSRGKVEALKLKEISYIHAEGYPAAEMKHGPIALVDNEMPTVVIATSDSIYDKTVSNIQQVKARGGRVVAIVTEGDTVASKIADYVIEIPEVCECLSPLLTSVPLQLLAYYIAVNKGRDVDQPRNLAKSVTVE